MASAGVPSETIQSFAETIRWIMCFLTEPRNGDRFALA